MTGFHAWGQWHRRSDTGDHLWHNQPHPNHHVQFLGIEMLDGNGPCAHETHQNTKKAQESSLSLPRFTLQVLTQDLPR
jgi:hypothetical protein